MANWVKMLILSLIAVVAFTYAINAAEREEIFTVPADGRVSILVNGVPGQAEVSPSGSIGPVMDKRFALLSNLRLSRTDTKIRIGPESLEVGKSSAVLEIGGLRQRRAVLSVDNQNRVKAYDIVMGPMDIPLDTVRFNLNDIEAGERNYNFPLSDFSGEGGGYGLAVTLGSDSLRIFFKPLRPSSLATATGATLIASKNQGQFDGNNFPLEIFNGVKRPVRTVILKRRLVIGPLSVSKFDARVADYGQTTIGLSSDPNEIVVTGSSEKAAQYRWLTIGGDDLSHCSSLTMNKRRMTLTLRCRPMG